MDIIRHIASDNIGVYHIPSAPKESDSAIRLMLCSTSPRPIDMAVACLGRSSAVMNPPISTLKPRIMYEKLYEWLQNNKDSMEEIHKFSTWQ